MKKILSLVFALCFMVSSVALAQDTKKSEPSKTIKVLMVTTLGDIELELYPDKAPATVDNFIKLVNKGFYNGLIFHRVIKDFMVQGGGFDTDMNQKESPFGSIKNEANNRLKNERGTIAMARTNDPHSATAQFFINHKTNPFLDFRAETQAGWGYAVFGKVIKGIETVDKIAAVQTASKGFFQDVPVAPIIIKEIKVIK